MPEQPSSNLPAIAMAEQKRTAAFLLAKGRPRKEVARIVGVAPESVSRWKQDPAFTKAIDEFRNLDLERLSDVIARTQLVWLDAGEKALEVALDMLEATKDGGEIDWWTRARGAELIMRGMAEFGGFRALQAGDGVTAHAAAAAVIVVKTQRGDEITISEGKEDIEDGDWKTVRGGDADSATDPD